VDLSPAALLDPRTALSLAGRLRRSAVRNARSAAELLGQQVAERRLLAPTDDDAPGALSRLTREQCFVLLSERRVARLAYVARAGVPDVVPVNYTLHDGAGADEDAHTGWSVVAVGRARRLPPSEQDALPPEALPAAWARGPRTSVIRVHVTRVDGRVLH
jgi:hypothetical protein